MRVLVTPQFNTAMQGLDASAQAEAARLFAMASALSQEQLVQSPLLTRLDTAEEIFTLRGQSVRVFCAFDSANDLLFLDVSEANDLPLPSAPQRKSEVTLFGKSGDPQAYISAPEGNTVYSFGGEPLAYIDAKNNIYGFNGVHLGWFEDDVVWDQKGLRVGFTSKTCPVFTQFEPFKGFKRFKPFKAFKQFAPFKPFKSQVFSESDLIEFLRRGSRTKGSE